AVARRQQHGFHVDERRHAERHAGGIVAVEHESVVAVAAVDVVEGGEVVVDDDRIVAGAGAYRVVAAVAVDGVVPGAALQVVGRTVAGDEIVMVGTDDALDIAEAVARGVAAGVVGVVAEVDDDAGPGVRIARIVEATRAAVEGIGAAAALENVAVLVAGQHVVMGGTD